MWRQVTKQIFPTSPDPISAQEEKILVAEEDPVDLPKVPQPAPARQKKTQLNAEQTLPIGLKEKAE